MLGNLTRRAIVKMALSGCIFPENIKSASLPSAYKDNGYVIIKSEADLDKIPKYIRHCAIRDAKYPGGFCWYKKNWSYEDGYENNRWIRLSNNILYINDEKKLDFLYKIPEILMDGLIVLIDGFQNSHYKIYDTISIPSNCDFIGINSPKLIFNFKKNGPCISIFNAKKSSLTSINIECDRPQGVPLVLVKGESSEIIISGNSILPSSHSSNFHPNAIDVECSEFSDIAIVGNNIVDCAYGIIVGLISNGKNISGRGILIEGNLITDSVADCIEINTTSSNVSGCIIRGNTLSTNRFIRPKNAGFGIGLAAVSDVIISDNVVLYSSGPGIHVEDNSHGIIIQENKILCSGINGIEILDNSGNGKLSANSTKIINNYIMGSDRCFGIIKANVVERGVGLRGVPKIRVISKYGVAAELRPRLRIARIDILNSGVGYHGASFLFEGGGNDHAKFIANVVNGIIFSIDIIYPGSGYVKQPEIIINSLSGCGAKACAIIGGDGRVSSVVVVHPGDNYIDCDIVCAGGLPHAEAYIYTDKQGRCLSIEVRDGGLYKELPKVSLISTGSGINFKVMYELHDVVVAYPGVGFIENEIPSAVFEGEFDSPCAIKLETCYMNLTGIKDATVNVFPLNVTSKDFSVKLIDEQGVGGELLINLLGDCIHNIAITNRGLNYKNPSIIIGDGANSFNIPIGICFVPSNYSSVAIKLSQRTFPTVGNAVISGNKIGGKFRIGIQYPKDSVENILKSNYVSNCDIGADIGGTYLAQDNTIEDCIFGLILRSLLPYNSNTHFINVKKSIISRELDSRIIFDVSRVNRIKFSWNGGEIIYGRPLLLIDKQLPEFIFSAIIYTNNKYIFNIVFNKNKHREYLLGDGVVLGELINSAMGIYFYSYLRIIRAITISVAAIDKGNSVEHF